MMNAVACGAMPGHTDMCRARDGRRDRFSVLTFNFCRKGDRIPRWRGWREAPGVDLVFTILYDAHPTRAEVKKRLKGIEFDINT